MLKNVLERLAFAVVVISAIHLGCSRPHPPEISPTQAPPVDLDRVRSAHEAAGWPHKRAHQADLNGDGTVERLILTADVQLGDEGEPLWEDGHRWAVYVEEEGELTLLYAAFLPHGHAEAAIMHLEWEGSRNVLIQERTPHQARSLVVSYDGPGRATTVSAAHYQIEGWLPRLLEP